ncbi:MAG: MBOAT family protein [Planctomycetes bacterium]|nr:MBOAT family protein [Planctomycetota bacterium]
MTFNSYTFVVFFACVCALHRMPLPWGVKKFNLLWASYLFYAAWNPPFVVLLWISTLVDWFVGKRLHAARHPALRRGLLGLSLIVNLGLLCFFKYGDFLLDNFVAAASCLGIGFEPARPSIVLPIGISFYTFQTLSYTLDIYYRKLKPWPSFLDYALYVTFFPQLVAGPIVRAREFLPQCLQFRKATGAQFGWGLSLMVIGLFQKIVLADGILAPVVEGVYDVSTPASPLTAWCATLAFSGQIFCDFAGYSSCAVGAAMCLGFRVPDNFRAPYAAAGFSDFWRRWHISLSTWLRDYLYIPLGGNRIGRARTAVNIMVTMLLGGLWHGAAWTCVVWGGLHGVFLVGERFLRQGVGSARLWTSAIGQGTIRLATYAAVCVTWAVFRSNSLSQAWSMLLTMLGQSRTHSAFAKIDGETYLALGVVGCVVLFHQLLRDSSIEALVERAPWWLRSVAIAAMLFCIATMPGEDRAFIYFQF